MRLQSSPYTILLGIAAIMWFSGCSPEPRAIRYGAEACQTCKMTLVEKRFGGELVSKTSKVFVFDDLNCLLKFYHHEIAMEDLAFTLVVDYEHGGELMNAGQTFFVKLSDLRSPMAGNVAAFKSYERAMEFKNTRGGILLGWAEVTTQFK